MRERLQIYLPPSALAHLRSIAARQQTTTSSAARRLVLSSLAGAGWRPTEAPQNREIADPHHRPHRVHVRLSGVVFEALEAVAGDHGQAPSAWTAALLAHCLLGRPLQRRDELHALREATRQLTAVGVLLNQVARAMNTQIKSHGAADPASMPGGLIEQCQTEIRLTTGAAHRLMDANLQAYRCADAQRAKDLEHAHG